MWIRWTVPRLRIDQVMSFAWKLLVPASLLAVALTGLAAVHWEAVMRRRQNWLRGHIHRRVEHRQGLGGDAPQRRAAPRHRELSRAAHGPHRPALAGPLGHLRDEEGRLKCTACLACQKACPSAAIPTIEGDEKKGKERRAKTYVWDAGRCLYCGYCVEACPFDAIVMTQDYSIVTADARGPEARAGAVAPAQVGRGGMIEALHSGSFWYPLAFAHLRAGHAGPGDHGGGSPATSCIPRCGCWPVWPAWPGSYLLLNAEFLAAMQILVYCGGIVLLFLFAIMLTPRVGDPDVRVHSGLRRIGACCAAVALAAGVGAVASATRPGRGPSRRPGRPEEGDRRGWRRRWSGPYVLAFEAAVGGAAGGHDRRHRDRPCGVERMSPNCHVPIDGYVVVSVLLFAIGLTAVLVRRNAIAVLMGVELMLNAANSTSSPSGATAARAMEGLVFAVVVITLAAAEAALALAIILSVYRRFHTVNVDQVDLMKG